MTVEQEPDIPEEKSEPTSREGIGGDDTPSKISYQVTQEGYQGPLDKLLELVREHELDIFRVSLATIAEEFCEYVESLDRPDLEEVGEYLVVASNLMLLKSRQLLPTETVEEEEEEIDEQALLLKRLKDYERFKEAANLLREAEAKRRQLYVREKTPPGIGEREVIEFYEVNVFDLATAFQKVLKEIGDEGPPTIQGEEYTIDEKMAELQLLLHEKEEICLTLYLQSMQSRVEVIVTFLALLELMRLLRVRAKQDSTFGDIWIYRTAELQQGDGELDIVVAPDEEGFVGPSSLDETGEAEDEVIDREEERRIENNPGDLGE